MFWLAKIFKTVKGSHSRRFSNFTIWVSLSGGFIAISKAWKWPSKPNVSHRRIKKDTVESSTRISVIWAKTGTKFSVSLLYFKKNVSTLFSLYSHRRIETQRALSGSFGLITRTNYVKHVVFQQVRAKHKSQMISYGFWKIHKISICLGSEFGNAICRFESHAPKSYWGTN